jgi:hypothetical protein
VSQAPSKSIIRKPYEFAAEAVNIGFDPAPGDRIPFLECRRCHRRLPQDQFCPVSPPKTVSSRVARNRWAIYLHPHCARCRTQARGQHVEHDLYSPTLDAYFAKLTLGARGGATARGIAFFLDKDDVLGMFLDQRGVCSLTGLEMDWKTPGSKGRNGRNYKAPSIDRIDSSGNYVLGNVQLVMRIANIMKNDLPQDMFVGLCRKIADHNVSL